MRELLKSADTNTATGRDNIVKANSDMVNNAVKTAGTVITSLLGAKSGSGETKKEDPKKEESKKDDKAQTDDSQKCEDTSKTEETSKADDTENNVCSSSSSEKSESQSTAKE